MDAHLNETDVARALPQGNRQPVGIGESFGAMFNRVGTWFGGRIGGWSLDGGLPTPSTGGWVTESSAVSMPAVWKCAGFLANAVASCAPPTEFDSNDERVASSPVVQRPWALLSPHEFWCQVVLSLLINGNFIGIKIDVDPDTDYPRQILPIPADQVRFTFDEDTGLPIYAYDQNVYGWDEVIHIRNGYQRAGSLWGAGVVQQFRESLSETGDLANYGRSNFSTAAENSVVIQVDRPQLEATEAQAVQDLWVQRHASGTRRPAVIPRSMTITPLSFSPADAQFLESRQFSIAEIAFMFLMDPTDLTAVIGQGGSITYANREQREIERLTHPVGHLMRRIEQSWADLLPGKRTMAFNVERLLRSDTLSRLQASDIGLRTGIFTLNDARNIERLPVYGDWADVPFAHPEPEPETEPEPTPATAEAV